MSLALIYDPRYHTFNSWADLMVEAYAGQQLEIPRGEEHWKEWANIVKSIDLFANEAVPDPYLYENWQDWVDALRGAVNQRSQ